MRLHFLSGLPRAGSTLLASLLHQNPNIHASIMSPVGQIVTDAVTAMGERNEARVFISDKQRCDIVRGIFRGYYTDYSREYIIDNNRRWCANIPLLQQVYPKSTIIACVRPFSEIIDSFERLFNQNLIPSIIFGGMANTTIYERVSTLMSEAGVVGFSYRALKTAYYNPATRRNLYLVEYGELASDPERVMSNLHTMLHLPRWRYNFNKVEPIASAEAFDAQLGTIGLHDLLPKVEYKNRPYCLPPDIVKALPTPFWRSKESVTAPE